MVQAARVDSAVLAGLAEAVASHLVKRLSHYLAMLKNLNRSNALRFFYFFCIQFHSSIVWLVEQDVSSTYRIARLSDVSSRINKYGDEDGIQ